MMKPYGDEQAGKKPKYAALKSNDVTSLFDPVSGHWLVQDPQR